MKQRPSESMRIATYNERYIVFASDFPGLGARDFMDSIYIYDTFSGKMVVNLPNTTRKVGDYEYGYDWAIAIHKSKKGTFLLFLSDLSNTSSVIEINPRNGKITEL